MIAYLDTSALVKRYVAERGSSETIAFTSQADVVATSIVSRAEIAAALAKAARTRVLTPVAARKAQRAFTAEWQNLVRVAVSEAVVERAERMAWDHALRGYDAVHLATALSWQGTVDPGLTFATFDRRLWEVARLSGLEPWPPRLD